MILAVVELVPAKHYIPSPPNTKAEEELPTKNF
jgi:hypothetical protein